MSKEITKEMVHNAAIKFVDMLSQKRAPWSVADIEKALTAEFLPEEYNVHLFNDEDDPADVQLAVTITDDSVSIKGCIQYEDCTRNRYWTVNRRTKQESYGRPALSIKAPGRK